MPKILGIEMKTWFQIIRTAIKASFGNNTMAQIQFLEALAGNSIQQLQSLINNSDFNPRKLITMPGKNASKKTAIEALWEKQQYDLFIDVIRRKPIHNLTITPNTSSQILAYDFIGQRMQAILNGTTTELNLSKINLRKDLIQFINHFKKKWPQPIFLNLSNCQLQDDCIKDLVKIIYAKGKIYSVNLSGNCFTTFGTTELLKVMAENRTLEHIDLSNMPIENISFANFARALAKYKGKQLKLNFNNCNLGTKDLEKCLHALDVNKKVLWQLRGNAIDNSGMQKILDFIQHNPRLRNQIECFDLRDNPVSDYALIEKCLYAKIPVLITMQKHNVDTNEIQWLAGFKSHETQLQKTLINNKNCQQINKALQSSIQANIINYCFTPDDGEITLPKYIEYSFTDTPAIIQIINAKSKECVALFFVTNDYCYLQVLEKNLNLKIDTEIKAANINKLIIDNPTGNITLNSKVKVNDYIYLNAKNITTTKNSKLSSQQGYFVTAEKTHIAGVLHCETGLVTARDVECTGDIRVMAQLQINAQNNLSIGRANQENHPLNCGGRLMLKADAVFLNSSIHTGQYMIDSKKCFVLNDNTLESSLPSYIQAEKFSAKAKFIAKQDLYIKAAIELCMEKGALLNCDANVSLSAENIFTQADLNIIGNLDLSAKTRVNLAYSSICQIAGDLNINTGNLFLDVNRLNIGGLNLQSTNVWIGKNGETKINSRNAILMHLKKIVTNAELISMGDIKVLAEDQITAENKSNWKSFESIFIDTNEFINQGKFKATDLTVKMKELTNYHSGLFEAKDNLSVIGDKFWNAGTLKCYDGKGNLTIALNRFLFHGIVADQIGDDLFAVMHAKNIRVIAPLYVNALSMVSATRSATIMSLIDIDMGFNPATFMYKYSLLSINLSLSIPNPMTVIDVLQSLAREEYKSLFDDFCTLQNLMYGINTAVSLTKIFFPKVGIIIAAIWTAIRAGMICYSLYYQISSLYEKYKSDAEIQIYELIPLIVGVSQIANIAVAGVHAVNDLTNVAHDIQQHGVDALKPPHLSADEFINMAETLVGAFGPRYVDNSLISLDAGFTASGSITHESLLSVSNGFQAAPIVIDQFLVGEVNDHVAAYNYSVSALVAKIDSDLRACENGSLKSFFLVVDDQVKATHGDWCISSKHLHWHNPTFTTNSVIFDVNNSDQYDLLYGRGRFSNTQPTKLIGLKTPYSMNLTEKWNRGIGLYLNADGVTVSGDINADELTLISRKQDLNIDRRAKVHSKHNASLAALSGDVNDRGEVTADNHVSAYASHDVNVLATDYTYMNSHGYRATGHHQAVLHGGKGEGFGDYGTSVTAGNRVFNYGSEISATGSNFVSARHGYVERSRVVANPHYRSRKHHHPHKHRTVQIAKLYSENGKNIILAPKGGVHSIGGQFISKAGTEIYARDDVNLDPLIFRAKQNTGRFTGMSYLVKHKKYDAAIPTLVADSGTSVIYSQKGDVYGKGALFIGPGKLKIKGKVVDMRPTLLNHHDHSREMGVSVSVMGIKFKHGAHHKRQLKQLDPTVSKVFDINRNKGETPSGKFWNLGLSAYNSANQLARGYADGSILGAMAQRYGLGDGHGFNPKVSVGFTDRDTHHNYQTVCPSGFYRGSVDIDASDTVHLGNGMQANIAHDMHIKAPHCFISGTELRDDTTTTENGVNFSCDARGNLGSVGASSSKSTNKGSHYQNAYFNIGGTLDLDVGDLHLDGARIDAKAVTGHVDSVYVTSHQSHYNSSSRQVGFSTAGDVSYSNFHRKTDQTSMLSGIFTQDAINTSGEDAFTVGELHTHGGGIASATSGTYAPTNTTNEDYYDHSYQTGWGFSGNLASIFNPQGSIESASGQIPTMGVQYANQGDDYVVGSKHHSRHGVNLAIDVPLATPSVLEDSWSNLSSVLVAETSSIIPDAQLEATEDSPQAIITELDAEVAAISGQDGVEFTTKPMDDLLTNIPAVIDPTVIEDETSIPESPHPKDAQEQIETEELFSTTGFCEFPTHENTEHNEHETANAYEASALGTHTIGETLETLHHREIFGVSKHLIHGVGLIGDAIDFTGYLFEEFDEHNKYAVTDAGVRTSVHIGSSTVPLYGLRALDASIWPMVVTEAVAEFGNLLYDPYLDAYEENIIYNSDQHSTNQVYGAMTDLGVRNDIVMFSDLYHHSLNATSNYIISTRPYQFTRDLIYTVADHTTVDVEFNDHPFHPRFRIGFAFELGKHAKPAETTARQEQNKHTSMDLLLSNSSLFYQPKKLITEDTSCPYNPDSNTLRY